MKCEVSNSTYYSSEDFVKYLETIESVTNTYFSEYNLSQYSLKEIKTVTLCYSKNEGLRVRMVKDAIWIRIPYKNNLYKSDLERVAAANENTIPERHFEDFSLYILPYLIEDHSRVTHQAKSAKFDAIARINERIPVPTIHILKRADASELKKARHVNLLNKEKELIEKLKCQLSIIQFHKNSLARAETMISELQESLKQLQSKLEKA